MAAPRSSFTASLLFVSVCFLSYLIAASSAADSTTKSDPITTTHQTPPLDECSPLNATCETCAKRSDCYWCENTRSCHHYKWTTIRTYFDHCSWGDARWKFCWLNVEAMVISVSLLGCILLISCCCCCCWCNRKCRARAQRRMKREEAEMERRTDERKEKNAQRSDERRARLDGIRDKYGIPKTGEARYERMNK